MISDHEKIFDGSKKNPVLNLIIFSVKDVIYQKRKTVKEMVITGVKKCLLKSPSVIKAKETLSDSIMAFEVNLNLFILDFREDIHTVGTSSDAKS